MLDGVVSSSLRGDISDRGAPRGDIEVQRFDMKST